MKIQRYSPDSVYHVRTGTVTHVDLIPDADGEAVLFDDHAAEIARLTEERDGFNVQLAEARATIAELQWTPITPENLPKVGDEVGCFADDGCCVYEVCDLHLLFTYEVWVKQRAMTHFRPISPPAQDSATEVKHEG
jgi:hypothetical protein